MTLELNEVLLEGEPRTLSLMAKEGRVTCLTGGTEERLTRYLWAMMGFGMVKNGYVSIEGEPLTTSSASILRRMMAFAPARLSSLGEIRSYEPPTVQDVFNLRINRSLPISNGILAEEVRRVAPETDDERVQLLAVASLLNRPLLLVDNPLPSSLAYLRGKAAEGRTVIIASRNKNVVFGSDVFFEI